MGRERGAAIGDEMQRAEHVRRVGRVAGFKEGNEALDNPWDRVQHGRPQITARIEDEIRRELLVVVGEYERPAARV